MHTSVIMYKEQLERQISNLHTQLATLDAVDRLLDRLATLPSFNEDVNMLWLEPSFDYSGLIGVVIVLGKRDSSLVRDTARLFGAKFIKRRAWSGETLIAHATVTLGQDQICLVYRGYLPESCRIVYTDEVIPEHIEKKVTILCGGEDHLT